MELRSDGADESSIEFGSHEKIINIGAFGNQQKHRKAPKEIERHQPALRAKRVVGNSWQQPVSYLVPAAR